MAPMNPPSDNDAPRPEPLPGASRANPSNWREALTALIQSRVALIQHESKDAAKNVARRGLSLVGVIICAFYTWGLFLAAGIAFISTEFGWQWYDVAFCAAGLHLVAALIFVFLAVSRGNASFPVTRAEFQKDREWIDNLHNPRKSDV